VRGVVALMMTDPIADMLTRLRNANTAFHDEVLMPSSKLKEALAASSNARATSRVGTSPRTRGVRQPAEDRTEVHARPQAHDLRTEARLEARLRVYMGSHDVPRVLGGMGIAILSTNQDS